MVVLGTIGDITWSLSDAELLRNSANGSGGALAFTLPVQGTVCQHCRLQGNTAGLLGGALFSTAKAFCVRTSNQQVGKCGACCTYKYVDFWWDFCSVASLRDHCWLMQQSLLCFQ